MSGAHRLGAGLALVAVVAVAGAAPQLSGDGGTGPAAARQTAPARSLAPFESLDARFGALVPADAALEVVASGYEWLEGPAWSGAEEALYFSDIPGNRVLRWRRGEGVAVAVEPSGYSGSAPFTGREPGSNGLVFDDAGRLLLCQHGDRAIARREPDGRLVPLVTHYRGRRLNSPNDLALRRNGELYFTDPPFGLPRAFDDPAREIPWSGVYRLGTGGEVELLSRELDAPNGLAFSPDEGVLYVSNASPRRAVWMRFDVLPDGGLSPGRVLFDVTSRVTPEGGLPDGLAVDEAGNLFATGPEGIYVLTPEGEHLGTIRTGTKTSNCSWGEDGSTLFLTASGTVYRLRLATRGAGWSRVATEKPAASRGI